MNSTGEIRLFGNMLHTYWPWDENTASYTNQVSRTQCCASSFVVKWNKSSTILSPIKHACFISVIKTVCVFQKMKGSNLVSLTYRTWFHFHTSVWLWFIPQCNWCSSISQITSLFYLISALIWRQCQELSWNSVDRKRKNQVKSQEWHFAIWHLDSERLTLETLSDWCGRAPPHPCLVQP